MSILAWQPLSEDDLPALRSLADRCLAADGGLPLLSEEGMLRRFFLSGSAIGGRDETGDLVAAASVFLDGAGHRTASGLIHPSSRWQGIGDELVKWCREHSGGSLLRVVAETTSADSDRFFADIGLRRTFAEHVMRHPLVEVPKVRRPAGMHSLPWSDDTAALFHTAYARSFATRPGFPDTPREEWVDGLRAEDGFRPEASRVVVDQHGHVAGFVTLSDNWIDQVGVVPEWLGHGLGAHLVARSLRALRKAGCQEAWLSVNVDNPAHELYLRLGFEDAGIRARYEETHR